MFLTIIYQMYILNEYLNGAVKAALKGKHGGFVIRHVLQSIQVCRIVVTEPASHDTLLTKKSHQDPGPWVTVILSVQMKRC